MYDYENHQLAGSLDVYLPLIKMDLKMEYICKAPIGTLEEYICRCIKQGITERYGIMDALALEDTVVNHLVNQLMEQHIIKEEAGRLSFTNIAYNLTDTPKSKQHKKSDVIWCYKGLMNPDKKIDTHKKSIEDAVRIETVLEEAHNFYLLPNVLMEVKASELKALNEKLLYYPNQAKEEILELKNLDIIKERTVLYEKYKILFFKGLEGNVKVLVHKVEDSQKIDEAFTKTLQRMNDRSELFKQMKYTAKQDKNQIDELIKTIGATVVSKSTDQ
ncbi:MAG: hypothetical protein E7231_08950 [Cellulosilyticum sp.]|nr:hypothetical protein [Cellulosilyticum sp.]